MQYDDLRPDEVDAVQEAWTTHGGAKLAKRLFSADFPDQCAALDWLASQLPGLAPAAVTSGVDLLTKAVWVRLAVPNCNPSVMLKGLAVLDALAQRLDSLTPPYELLDCEADALVPVLLEKALGHNNKQISAKASEVCQRLSTVLAGPKIMAYCLDAVRSKNTKVAASALLELDALLTKLGVDAVIPQPSKILPRLAKTVGTNDASVRAAALQVLASIFASIGDPMTMWKLIGDEVDKDAKTRSLIEERLKRTKIAPKTLTSVSLAATATATATAALAATRGAAPRPTTAPPTPVVASAPASAPVPVAKVGVPSPARLYVPNALCLY